MQQTMCCDYIIGLTVIVLFIVSIILIYNTIEGYYGWRPPRYYISMQDWDEGLWGFRKEKFIDPEYARENIPGDYSWNET